VTYAVSCANYCKTRSVLAPWLFSYLINIVIFTCICYINCVMLTPLSGHYQHLPFCHRIGYASHSADVDCLPNLLSWKAETDQLSSFSPKWQTSSTVVMWRMVVIKRIMFCNFSSIHKRNVERFEVCDSFRMRFATTWFNCKHSNCTRKSSTRRN